MKDFWIVSPNRRYSGTGYGVSFEDGVGHTSDAKVAEAFRERGYYVTQVSTENDPERTDEEYLHSWLRRNGYREITADNREEKTV